MYNYSLLQTLIDECLGKHGLNTVIDYIKVLNSSDLEEKYCNFVKAIVASHYKISVEEMVLLGDKKHKVPRMICMHIMRYDLEMSLGQISKYFENREKTRVSSCIKELDYFLSKPKSMEGLVQSYKEIQVQVNEFVSILKKIHNGQTKEK